MSKIRKSPVKTGQRKVATSIAPDTVYNSIQRKHSAPTSLPTKMMRDRLQARRKSTRLFEAVGFLCSMGFRARVLSAVFDPRARRPMLLEKITASHGRHYTRSTGRRRRRLAWRHSLQVPLMTKR